MRSTTDPQDPCNKRPSLARALAVSAAVLGLVAAVVVVVVVEGAPRSQPPAQADSSTVLEGSQDLAGGKVGKRTSPPAASPVAEGSVAVAWRRYVSLSAGFEIETPVDWAPIEGGGTTRFRTDQYVVELSVSVGDRSGLVTICNTAPCQTVRVADIDDLDAALETHPTGIGGGDFEEWTGKASVDGQAGRVQGPEQRPGSGAGPQANVNVFAILEGRPIVLRFRYSYQHQGVPTVDQARVIASFQLIDEPQSRTWKRHTSQRDGYTVSIPRSWVAVEEDGVTFFRTERGVQFAVSVGDESGRVTVCNARFFNSAPCSSVRVRTVEDLARVVWTHPAGSGGPGQETIETYLDGWAARIETPDRSPFLVGPETYTNAYGIVDGRPVVLRFSYSYRHQETPTKTQLAVLRSFTLGDASK